MTNRFILILLAFLPSWLSAQELNCSVRVEAPKNQTIEPRVFKTLENAVYEFMNGRRWTTDAFLPNEKIKCSIIINITEAPTEGDYKATFIVQSQRPVYNSNYSSPVFNFQDRTADFEYYEFQQLEYISNGYLNNLTSLLAYYAYIIIGYDYDTFSPNGGTPWFLKAQEILNAVPGSARGKFKGWTAFDGNRNRFTLIDEILNPRYKSFRSAMYMYHLSGMDKLYDDITVGRVAIMSALMQLDAINGDNPSTMMMRNFFTAKSEEIKNVFSKADISERSKAVELLSRIDPINAEKYRDLLK